MNQDTIRIAAPSSTDYLQSPHFRCASTVPANRTHTDKYLCIANTLQYPSHTFSTTTRGLHTTCSPFHSNKDVSKTSIDEFRANEEKIERDYEEQQKQQQNEQEKETTSSSDSEDHAKIQEIRYRILDAALQFVPKDGWSREAIAHGAESMNYPGVAHGMFPNGGIELIHHFYSKCNRELIERLKQDCSGQENVIKTTLSPKEFCTKAIQMRLEMIIPYIDTWPQALALMTLPQNVQTSLAQLLTLVDDICYCAGDRSVDFGWYTRRIGIATIYKWTELFLLQDKSPNYQKTWEFLERRMEEGVHIQEFLNASDQKTKNVTKAVGSAFQTARNILGINNCDRN